MIEDAAHATGAEYKGRPIGSISEVTCFSFHAVKNLATGEGGMITVASPDHDRRVRTLRWMGITKDTWNRAEDLTKYSWYYDVVDVGYKDHLSDIAAAIGLVQLAKLPRTNGRRREIAGMYTAALKGLDWVETPIEEGHVKSSWHNYVIKVPDRDRLMSHLQALGIATGMHYIPNHLFPVYKPWYQRLPVAERVWKRLVTLPLFPDLTNDQVHQIVDAIRSFGDRVNSKE